MKRDEVADLISQVRASVPGLEVRFYAAEDRKNLGGRIYLQCAYDAPCSVTGEAKEWRGRKWYLSEHMTEDEVVKTAFAAFKATVEHEVMEGFTFAGVRVFNPHVNFRALMAVSGRQVFRKPQN